MPVRFRPRADLASCRTVGKIAAIWKTDDGSGDVDVDVTLSVEDADKVGAAVWAGVKCAQTPAGGSVISLVDRLGDDAGGAPKWAKLAKADGDEFGAILADELGDAHRLYAKTFT